MKVLNSLKISKNDTNKLWEAIEKFNVGGEAEPEISQKPTPKAKNSMYESKRTRLSTFREDKNDTLPLNNTSFVDFLDTSFNQSSSMLKLEPNSDNLVKLSKYQVKYSFGSHKK
jgi:hypothetical protein